MTLKFTKFKQNNKKKTKTRKEYKKTKKKVFYKTKKKVLYGGSGGMRSPPKTFHKSKKGAPPSISYPEPSPTEYTSNIRIQTKSDTGIVTRSVTKSVTRSKTFKIILGKIFGSNSG